MYAGTRHLGKRRRASSARISPLRGRSESPGRHTGRAGGRPRGRGRRQRSVLRCALTGGSPRGSARGRRPTEHLSGRWRRRGRHDAVGHLVDPAHAVDLDEDPRSRVLLPRVRVCCGRPRTGCVCDVLGVVGAGSRSRPAGRRATTGSVWTVSSRTVSSVEPVGVRSPSSASTWPIVRGTRPRRSPARRPPSAAGRRRSHLSSRRGHIVTRGEDGLHLPCPGRSGS